MRNERAIAATLTLAALLLPPRAALAYCRTSSCGAKGTGQSCLPAQPGDCGLPLFWASPCVGYSIQQGASSQVSFSATEQIMKDAFAAWEGATCSGGSPRIVVTELAPATCSKHEYNQEKGNTNLIVFRDDGWPYEGSSNTLALTTVTYNLDTGEIYDADLEVNSADNKLTTSDTAVEFDLLSITTHEAGHFLGLAHSMTADATMFPAYKPGEIGLRSLDADDVLGICAVYPAGAPIPPTCDDTPRHGFSTLCGAEQSAADTSSSGCACRLGAGPERGEAAGIFAAALGLGIASRRRAKRARKGEGARCR
jgi:hypothetical protein